VAWVAANTDSSQPSFLELESKQIHLRGTQQSAVTQQSQPAPGSRPAAPQYIDPIPALGSGTRNSLAIGAPELLAFSQAPTAPGGQNFNVAQIPPSMYFTSPYDYEADDAANSAAKVTPDTWYERVGKTKDMHKRTYNSIIQGTVPRMGWMGTGIRRPINPLMEASELSDIDPWRHAATQIYSMFRSPARNPEMKGQTLRRLQKSEVLGFDHTNGQYGVPLGNGIRGIGGGSMGLTKFDYGPYGMGPMHPNPLMHAINNAQQSIANQMAAPFGANALLGVQAPFLPFT